MRLCTSGHPSNPVVAVPRLPTALVCVIGLPALGLLVGLALYSLPGARQPATPESVKTVRIIPGAPASLVSPEADVTVDFEAGSVKIASVATYRSKSAWDIPDPPLGFVATVKMFGLSITGKETSVE